MLSSLRFRLILQNKHAPEGNMSEPEDNLNRNIKTKPTGRRTQFTMDVWNTASHAYERDRILVTSFSLFLLIVLASSVQWCRYPSPPVVNATSR